MRKIKRLVKHLTAARWQAMRRFPKRSMKVIEAAISSSEMRHMGELRFVVEAGLDWPELFSGVTSRERALDVFSSLHVWDTEHNSGVLIYLLLADHKVEIVADRGINARVDRAEWIRICHDMEYKFRMGDFENGVLAGISAISALLQQHYPAQEYKPNELPDRPAIL